MIEYMKEYNREGIWLKEYKSLNQKETPLYRTKRIRRIKKIIISIVSLLIIIPVILCIVLFLKVNSLQKQIDMLMIDKYNMTYAQMNNINKGVVHASGTSDNGNETLSKPVENKVSKEEYDYNIDTSIHASSNSNSMVDIKAGTDLQYTQEELKNEIDKNIQKSTDIINNNVESKKNRKVYLTFDDGPSKNTAKILDILDEYNVKATFFVVGKTDNYSKDIYKRIVDEGHSLGLHSYSHRYEIIYKSLDNFQYDLYKLQEFLYEVTGYKSNIYRFPGGSGNQVTEEDIDVFIDFLNKNNITYFDWNVVNGDASIKGVTAEESYDNVINGAKIYKNSVVLMHDANNKTSTVESLPHIIETLLEEDVEILPLSNEVKPIQQIESNKIYEWHIQGEELYELYERF